MIPEREFSFGYCFYVDISSILFVNIAIIIGKRFINYSRVICFLSIRLKQHTHHSDFDSAALYTIFNDFTMRFGILVKYSALWLKILRLYGSFGSIWFWLILYLRMLVGVDTSSL